MNPQHTAEAKRLRAQVKSAGSAFAKTSLEFKGHPETKIEGDFGQEWLPFEMGGLKGLSMQVQPTADTTALLINITQGGIMGLHKHGECKWESLLWLRGRGKLTYRHPKLRYMTSVELCPGVAKSHRADIDHDFECETGSQFVLAYTPRLPGDHVYESLGA